MHGTVDLSPLMPVVNTAVTTLASGIITFVVAWAGWFMKKYAPSFISAQMESKASADVNTALQNGMAIGVAKLQAWETVHKDIAVQGMVQRFAVQYAIDHAPGAINHFGLSPDELALKALAYLPMPPKQPASVTLPDGTKVTLGKPSNVAPSDEAAETAALNRQQVAK